MNFDVFVRLQHNGTEARGTQISHGSAFASSTTRGTCPTSSAGRRLHCAMDNSSSCAIQAGRIKVRNRIVFAFTAVAHSTGEDGSGVEAEEAIRLLRDWSSSEPPARLTLFALPLRGPRLVGALLVGSPMGFETLAIGTHLAVWLRLFLDLEAISEGGQLHRRPGISTICAPIGSLSQHLPQTALTRDQLPSA